MATPETGLLLTLAEAIADGSSVDWDAAEAQASIHEQPIIRQLRILATLAAVHRTLIDPLDAACGSNLLD